MPEITTQAYIGQRLKALRKAQKMTRRELADKLGVSAQMVWLYENGDANPPSSRVLQFAQILGAKVEDFYPLPGEPAHAR